MPMVKCPSCDFDDFPKEFESGRIQSSVVSDKGKSWKDTVVLICPNCGTVFVPHYEKLKIAEEILVENMVDPVSS